MFFLLTWGLLEEIEDFEQEEDEESEGNDFGFIQDPFYDYKLNYMAVQEDKLLRQGNLERRFFEGSFFFGSAALVELALTQKFLLNNFDFDVFDFVYIYFFHMPPDKPFILEDFGFSLNEEDKEGLEESIGFYGGIYDYELNDDFRIGLDAFRENVFQNLSFNLDLNLFFSKKFGSKFTGLSFLEKNKAKLGFLYKDFFINKQHRFGLDDMVFKFYYKSVLKTEFVISKFNEDFDDFSSFEQIDCPDPKIIRSCVKDILFSKPLFCKSLKCYLKKF
jgi:hypothetical protein